jgi:hypothetical protein
VLRAKAGPFDKVEWSLVMNPVIQRGAVICRKF